MLKLLGTAAVSGAVLLCGFYAESEAKCRMRRQDSLLSLIAYIKNAVGANIPPERLFDGYCDAEFERSGLVKELKKHGITALFTDEDDTHAADGYEKKLLNEFARSFARCPTYSDCAELCEKYIALMSSYISQNREKQRIGAQLSKKLGVIAAAAVFVILI